MKRLRTFCMVAIACLAFLGGVKVSTAEANANLQKAIKHISEFEIKQAVALLKPLTQSGALDDATKAKAYLHLGIAYMYLRKKDKAEPAFKSALQLDKSLALPKDTASRIKKFFNKVKASSGGGGGLGGGGLALPPARRAATPPVPAPTPRRTAAPAPRTSDPLALPPAPRKAKKSGLDLDGLDLPPVRRRPAKRKSNSLSFPSIRPPARVRVRIPLPRRTTPPARRNNRFKRKVAATDPSMDLDLRVKRPAGKGSPLKTTGWIVAGLAVALAGTGTAFGVMAAGTETKGKDVNTFQTEVPELQKTAQGQALYANIAFGAAGAAAVTAVILLLLPQKSAKDTTASSHLRSSLKGERALLKLR